MGGDKPEDDVDSLDEVMPKGMTWFGKVARRQADREDRADTRVDTAWHLAIQQAQAGNESKQRVIYVQWAFIAVLVAAVLTLAGHAVGLEVPGMGSFTSGS